MSVESIVPATHRSTRMLGPSARAHQKEKEGEKKKNSRDGLVWEGLDPREAGSFEEVCLVSKIGACEPRSCVVRHLPRRLEKAWVVIGEHLHPIRDGLFFFFFFNIIIISFVAYHRRTKTRKRELRREEEGKRWGGGKEKQLRKRKRGNSHRGRSVPSKNEGG